MQQTQHAAASGDGDGGGGAHGVAAHAPPAAHRAPQAEVCAVLGKLPVANGPGVVCSPRHAEAAAWERMLPVGAAGGGGGGGGRRRGFQ